MVPGVPRDFGIEPRCFPVFRVRAHVFPEGLGLETSSSEEWIRGMICAPVGTNVDGHKRRWAPTSVGTDVGGHKRRWAQTSVGTNVGGHKRRWAQTSVGTNVGGHKCR